MPRLIPCDIGCEPSPSVPAETLLQDSASTFLLFFACSRMVGTHGYFTDLGVAVVECVDCCATRFGYPNDEGLPEHPLYDLGLDRLGSNVLEVEGSAWAGEVSAQRRLSAKRIWGREPERANLPRHFVVCLKERTFECLAADLSVRIFAKDFGEAFAYVQERFRAN